MRSRLCWLLLAVLGPVAVGVYAACGGSDSKTTDTPPPNEAGAGYRGFEPAGQACTSASQCYVDHDAGEAGTQLPVKGTIYCETKVPNGYCTHECTSDGDCCAVPGECRTAVKQVCSPFTNTSTPMYCFLSCEDSDIRAAIAANVDAGGWDGGPVDGGGAFDPNTYCYYYASIYSECRSSGGGAKNRKVCIPKL
jgi:hypothetical protein